ncbi:hypothetical protein IT084_11790 [Desulfallas sp. Bu1-1]|uniref:hypothetical protein n=1 Tax=Desulfallas sp. Bu1-1 TaxID=2787620 RepID=UPI00189FE0C1|nr:hypothetical protein [Desulfallas sp. Bu1-1]MBF7083656.1 hypothetical protein [Desulfallas sp. Bu1-1]
MKVSIQKAYPRALYINTARSSLCAGLALTYLAKAYLQWPVLNTVLSIVCLFCILICFSAVRGVTRSVALILFLSGALLLVFAGADVKLWLIAVTQNANLITLLVLVPVFGMPLKYGGYYQVLDAMVDRYMNHRHRIYWVPALLGHFFGALMNMGAIPVVYKLIIHGKLPRVFQSVPGAILRGFSSSIYWSPNMVSVALVTYYLRVPWAEFARGGIILTLISLLVGWLIHLITDGKPQNHMDTNLPAREGIDRKKLAELFVFCSLFLGTIIYIATETAIPVLDAVPLLALAYPVFWLGVLGKGCVILEAYEDYMRYTLPGFASEIVMFLGAGFVAAALSITSIGDKISLFLKDFIGLNPYLLCFFIVSSIVLFSVVGVTPMVTVMAYSASLNPALMGLSSHLLSLVLVGGWATSVLVSPFTGVTLIMSGLTQKSSFEIARSNWLFGGVMVLLLSAMPLLQKCM